MFTERALEILHLTTTISSSLGLFGTLTMLGQIISNPHVFEYMTGRLLTGIVFTNIVDCSWKLVGRIGVNYGGLLCKAQSMVLQQTMLLQLLLGVCVTGYIFNILCLKRPMNWLKQYEYAVVIICLLIPIPSVIFMVYFEPTGKSTLIGDADFWCWIQTDQFSDYQIYLGYIPVIAFMAIESLMSLGIIATLFSSHSDHSILGTQQAFRNFMLKRTMIYLLACWIPIFPSLLNRLHFNFFKRESFELAMLQAIFSPLNGLANYIAFVLVGNLSKERKDHQKTDSRNMANTSAPILDIQVEKHTLFTDEQIQFVLREIMFQNFGSKK